MGRDRGSPPGTRLLGCWLKSAAQGANRPEQGSRGGDGRADLGLRLCAPTGVRRAASQQEGFDGSPSSRAPTLFFFLFSALREAGSTAHCGVEGCAAAADPASRGPGALCLLLPARRGGTSPRRRLMPLATSLLLAATLEYSGHRQAQ